MREETPNDPSSPTAEAGAPAARQGGEGGGSEAAGVTAGAVGCSAWLGVGGETRPDWLITQVWNPLRCECGAIAGYICKDRNLPPEWFAFRETKEITEMDARLKKLSEIAPPIVRDVAQ